MLKYATPILNRPQTHNYDGFTGDVSWFELRATVIFFLARIWGWSGEKPSADLFDNNKPKALAPPNKRTYRRLNRAIVGPFFTPAQAKE